VADKGGTQNVLAGAVSAAVVVALTLPAEVSVEPGWNAGDVWVVPASKTAAGFTANWANPVPAGGSSFDWGALDAA
jgi:hypothetical protein